MLKRLIAFLNTLFSDEANTCSYTPLSEPVIYFRECAHWGPRKFRVNFWGNILTPEVRFDRTQEIGGVLIAEKKCPMCVFELTRQKLIRCCFCGGPIGPGDGVALCLKDSSGVRRNIATYMDDQAVSCLRCGGNFAGHWTENGFVSAFPDEGLGSAPPRRKPIGINTASGEVEYPDTPEKQK